MTQLDPKNERTNIKTATFFFSEPTENLRSRTQTQAQTFLIHAGGHLRNGSLGLILFSIHR